MTLSMEMALDAINSTKGKVELDDLLFLLVVIRDNTPHDDVYQFLNNILKDLGY